MCLTKGWMQSKSESNFNPFLYQNLMNTSNYILDWIYVPGYNKKYLINKTGVLVSIKANGSHKVIKPRIDRAGYATVRLFKAGKTKTYYLHRLIAQLFIPNEHNKTHVNHKNGKKTNNWYENLEWVTHSENIQHAYNKSLINKKSKAVFDKCTNRTYKNSKEAAQAYGINHNTLRGYLNGQIKKQTCLEYKEN
jgi:hypothetical protein